MQINRQSTTMTPMLGFLKDAINENPKAFLKNNNLLMRGSPYGQNEGNTSKRSKSSSFISSRTGNENKDTISVSNDGA